MVLREGEVRVEPQFGFAGRVLNVNMGPGFLAGKEIEPVTADPEDGWAHVTRCAAHTIIGPPESIPFK